MKKILILVIGLLLMSDTVVSYANEYTTTTEANDGVIPFRGTQKMRANDGREIYFYANGKFEMYDGDRLVVSSTFRMSDGNVFLLDENGRTIYKGTYLAANNVLKSVRIGGTSYYWYK